MTRRTALTTLGSAAALVRSASAQQAAPEKAPAGKFGLSAPKRVAPMLCLYSQNLVKIPYPELGEIAKQIGYEGVDLTVMIGGHVDPRVTSVDLVRAFESLRGSDLEVPMISTTITSIADPTAYPVLYLTGHSQIPLFRLGFWPYGDTGDINQRLAQVRRDLGQVLALGQNCGIGAMFPNRAGGYVGQSTWDVQPMLAELDPHWMGYYFDPAEATAEGGAGGWEAALRVALPRLRAISLQDFYWQKDGDRWKMRKCPLGEGMVDWEKFFRMVAATGFAGPISLHQEYEATDGPGSLAKDLAFARKYVRQSWPNQTGT